MTRRSKTRKPKPDHLLFIRPARPPAGWPRDVVGDPVWAGMDRSGQAIHHNQPGQPVTKKEAEILKYAGPGLVRWPVFRVVPIPRKG